MPVDADRDAADGSRLDPYVATGRAGKRDAAWLALSQENRVDLVTYIKTFSPRWQSEKPGDPIKIPPEPAVTMESITHGAELFQKMECWKCHGQQGAETDLRHRR